MFLGDGLERHPSGLKSVSARIEFLVRIVGEGFRQSSCLVFEMTVVNVATSLILRNR